VHKSDNKARYANLTYVGSTINTAALILVGCDQWIINTHSHFSLLSNIRHNFFQLADVFEKLSSICILFLNFSLPPSFSRIRKDNFLQIRNTHVFCPTDPFSWSSSFNTFSYSSSRSAVASLSFKSSARCWIFNACSWEKTDLILYLKVQKWSRRNKNRKSINNAQYNKICVNIDKLILNN